MNFWEQYDKNRIIIFIGSILLLVCGALIVSLFIRIGKLEANIEQLKGGMYGDHTQEQLAADSSGISDETEKLYNTDDSSAKSISGQSGSEVIEIIDFDKQDEVEMPDPYEGMIKVYLTFDDGPGNNTDKILDILSDYGVKATFFVNGREKFDAQYKRIVDEGHSIGMHSYSHDYRKVYKSLDSFAEDLYNIQTLIYDKTGATTSLYRFPGGSSNNVSSMNMLDAISYLNAKDITYFDWNASAQDAVAGGSSTTQIVANVINTVSDGKEESYVVLLHDSDDKKNTVEALPIIIEKLADMENVVILPIDENTVPVQHVTVE